MFLLGCFWKNEDCILICFYRNTLQGSMNIEHIARVHHTLLPGCVNLCTYVFLRIYRSSLCKNSRKNETTAPSGLPRDGRQFLRSIKMTHSSSRCIGFTGFGIRLKVGVTFANHSLFQPLSSSCIHSRKSHLWLCIFIMQNNVMPRNAEEKCCGCKNIFLCFMEVQSTNCKKIK